MGAGAAPSHPFEQNVMRLGAPSVCTLSLALGLPSCPALALCCEHGSCVWDCILEARGPSSPVAESSPGSGPGLAGLGSGTLLFFPTSQGP